MSVWFNVFLNKYISNTLQYMIKWNKIKCALVKLTYKFYFCLLNKKLHFIVHTILGIWFDQNKFKFKVLIPLMYVFFTCIFYFS